jgi:hypothetical protein
MLKIAVTESSDQAVTMRLEGRVIGPWVAELGRSCDRVLDRDGRLILDLAHVSFIDRDGVALVRSLRDRGATLRGCSPFVAEQLRDVLRRVSRS